MKGRGRRTQHVHVGGRDVLRSGDPLEVGDGRSLWDEGFDVEQLVG